MRTVKLLFIFGFIAALAGSAAVAGPWRAVDDDSVGRMLVQTFSEAGEGRSYEGITAMCVGGKLNISLTAGRVLKKPDVFISEGGFGETRYAGSFLKITDGGPQIISLSESAAKKLYRAFVKTEAEGRAAGASEVSVNLGPGGLSGGEVVSVTNFAALSRSNLSCIK